MLSGCLAGHLTGLTPSALPCWDHVLELTDTQSNFEYNPQLLAILDVKETPDRKITTSRAFLRTELLLWVECLRTPRLHL